MATPRICSIDGCGKPHKAHGWCKRHYERWYDHGDPLGGGTEKGKVIRYFRDVVLAYEGDECLLWPFAKSPAGYGQLWLEGRLQDVCRRVCEDVNGPPPTPDHEAAHSCGKGHAGCATKSHLTWKTRVENQADRVVHGTTNRGERCGNAKLTEPDVRAILALKDALPQKEIADRFGVSRETVSGIHCGRRWGWLSA